MVNAFSLHARVIIREIPGVLPGYPHAELHLGHVGGFDSLEAAKPELHEVARGERAFQLKAAAITAQAIRRAGGAHTFVTEKDR